MEFAQLPVEIYIEILTLLPASRASPAEPTLLACLNANSVIRAAALASVVWRRPYLMRYTHSVSANEERRRAAAQGDWRLMYFARRRLDKEALRLVDEIRDDRAGRHERARTLAQTYSLDVWDALRRESQLRAPAWFTDSVDTLNEVDDGVERNALPRRYWAKVILGVIARYEAMAVWTRVFAQPPDPDVTFEEALAGLSAFFDVSTREVQLQLEEIHASCVDMLRCDGIAIHENEPGYDFWRLCDKLRETIHQLGFRLATGPNFYNLMNQFPHAFLSPHRRETIPMSLAYVYVAVARRLGIDASPANFPGVVQVHIKPPTSLPHDVPSLLDMRTDDAPLPLPGLQNAITAGSAPLHGHGGPPLISSSEAAEYTRPATADTMLARAYNNIIMFMRYERVYAGNMALPWSHEAHETAHYAISCALLLSTQNTQFAPGAPADAQPLDALAVWLDAVCPALHPIPRASVSYQSYRALEVDEERAKRVVRRSEFPGVRYFVGLVFRHATDGYVGCVYGWNDAGSQWSEGWVTGEGSQYVNRQQPFYRAIADDGQYRYVPQESINPIAPSKAFLPDLFKARSTFSRYFVDVELDEATELGRLVPSKELKDTYPEDDEFAASWIHGWS